MTHLIVLNCGRLLENAERRALRDRLGSGSHVHLSEFSLDGLCGENIDLATTTPLIIAAAKQFLRAVEELNCKIILIFPDGLDAEVRARIVRWLNDYELEELNRSEVAA